DAEGISKLATLAKEQGKNNVAFLCLFMLGRVEDCLQLLIESNRIPEAALLARSYLPSKVSEIVVNPKAAESLADHEEYRNLFEDWQVALAVESKAAETRCLEDLVSTTRYVSWSLHNKSRDGLRQFLDSFGGTEHSNVNNNPTATTLPQTNPQEKEDTRTQPDYNRFLLMPIVDKLPALLREDLESLLLRMTWTILLT
ncbi:hypothetical protein PIB30_059067, partial [Stylosanthes scabra]|nr:hypothetical protein [Stylosanthes scabra]